MVPFNNAGFGAHVPFSGVKPKPGWTPDPPDTEYHPDFQPIPDPTLPEIEPESRGERIPVPQLPTPGFTPSEGAREIPGGHGYVPSGGPWVPPIPAREELGDPAPYDDPNDPQWTPIPGGDWVRNRWGGLYERPRYWYGPNPGERGVASGGGWSGPQAGPGRNPHTDPGRYGAGSPGW